MNKINLKIEIAADNKIPAFAGYVNYFGDDNHKDQPRIMVNFNAMFSAMVEEDDFPLTYKEFFAENVVHEMLHMIQDIFGQTFDENEVEQAIMNCRKDK